MAEQTGILEVYAYADSDEVAALIFCEAFGYKWTPLTVELLPGSYILIGEWNGQVQVKSVIVNAGQTTTAKFIFIKPPPITIDQVILTMSMINLIIGLLAFIYGKPIMVIGGKT